MLLSRLLRGFLTRHGCQRCGASQSSRAYSTNTGDLSVYRLKSRGLVSVKGRDTIPFLQGLVTSDVESLGSVMGSQYSMLLNVQGRVLYDLILYDVSRLAGESAVLIECDQGLSDQFISDIKKYKIRKKVVLENMSDTYNVYAATSDKTENVPTSSPVIAQVSDPRVPQFGQRIIVESSDSPVIDNTDESRYHEKRMMWGIPEGPVDLPPGSSLPLESNLVFMNGVSFSKGCYLGQELTARTHHTGVTRKRIMPLVFENLPGEIQTGESIKNSNNKNVGKFRSSQGVHGLGLLRINELTETLSVVNLSGETVKLKAVLPSWWPDSSGS